MQFITGLFGGSGNAVLTMVLALGIVLVLIVLGVWLLKLISNVSGNAVRGRNRRLAVVDTLALDQKRQLLIVRRDNVEHLILTGGPQDVVVETGIPVAEVAPAPPARRGLPSLSAKKSSGPAISPASETPPETEVPPAPEPAKRPPRSLRHTGLLRPVSVQDPTLTVQNPDTPGGPADDSAKEDGNEMASEGEALEHQKGEQANRS
ncbi:flagellar biosynthetic protein FliO [Devosia sp. XK-2]|uniref:FliO/MopB family protein n=1 Tax=Devosia sp. XK-2 TaxID=3126689 RepID=UPI0030D4E963